MQRVGPGTVLGGRYALRRRLSQGRELERWSAHDATLERDVTITIVGSEHANRAGLLDAARRAAGVEDTRLVRILDVGTQKDNSFIVQETLSGSESLATLLLQGPLPAEEARRVAGETAQGLESARQRGLHHLRLTPQHVMIAPDGAIRVSGVAVAAAMDGPDEQEGAAAASRRDAVRLVAVVYAALTGRWPLDEAVSGLEPAPRVSDGVAAPSEIAGGVPRDLDALCRVTLNESAGPLTPGEFANRIAPWPHERLPRGDVDPTVAIPLPTATDVTEATEATEATEVTERVEVAEGSAASGGSQPTVAIASGAAVMADQPTESAPPPDAAAEPTNEPTMSPSGFAVKFDKAEPPLPLLPGSTALPPSGGQSKIVVLVVALFVGLALFFGYRGLLSPTSTPTVSKADLRPPKSETASAPPVVVPPSPAPSKTAARAQPIAILSATGFDPEGDDRESNDKAGRVYDDDRATSWTSELYTTAELGNLKKGVGVLLDLGQPTSVHQVTLYLGSKPVDLTVYAATDQSIKEATVIGEASDASERTKIKATETMPKAQYVIVWFTRLAPDDGQFTASVSEIALS